jgi:hypothetical protein
LKKQWISSKSRQILFIAALAAFSVYGLRPMSLVAHDSRLCIGADFQSPA